MHAARRPLFKQRYVTVIVEFFPYHYKILSSEYDIEISKSLDLLLYILDIISNSYFTGKHQRRFSLIQVTRSGLSRLNWNLQSGSRRI